MSSPASIAIKQRALTEDNLFAFYIPDELLNAPEGWVLLPPGDAALTRRVKAAGDHWVVQEKKGRKVFSRGVWAPAATVDRIQADLDAERSTEGFAKKKEADARRRDKAQAEYVEDFFGAVVTFLAFHGNYADLADRMARAVTDHATPVGSAPWLGPSAFCRVGRSRSHRWMPQNDRI